MKKFNKEDEIFDLLLEYEIANSFWAKYISSTFLQDFFAKRLIKKVIRKSYNYAKLKENIKYYEQTN